MILKLSRSMNRTATRGNAASRPHEGMLQTVAKQRPVGQAGQRIVERLVGQLIFESLVLRHVVSRADNPRQFARLVVERHGLRLVRAAFDLSGPGMGNPVRADARWSSRVGVSR